jgi:hypothetical protein
VIVGCRSHGIIATNEGDADSGGEVGMRVEVMPLMLWNRRKCGNKVVAKPFIRCLVWLTLNRVASRAKLGCNHLPHLVDDLVILLDLLFLIEKHKCSLFLCADNLILFSHSDSIHALVSVQIRKREIS